MNYINLFNKFSTSKIIARNSSKIIRKQFIDYFVKQHEHKFIKSSPVVPYCDPTVAFVNAGMNQVTCVFNMKNILYEMILFFHSLKIFF